MYSVESLVKVGGREWKKTFEKREDKPSGTFHRVYFGSPKLQKIYGLTITTHDLKTIESATVDGKEVSVNEARGLLFKFENVKVWYDVSDNEFHSKGDMNIADVIIERIKDLLYTKE